MYQMFHIARESMMLVIGLALTFRGGHQRFGPNLILSMSTDTQVYVWSLSSQTWWNLNQYLFRICLVTWSLLSFACRKLQFLGGPILGLNPLVWSVLYPRVTAP